MELLLPSAVKVARFAPLSDADQSMLKRHKDVRKSIPGEKGRQTFYRHWPLEGALQNGIAQGWLSSDEAATEHDVLLHSRRASTHS